LKNILKWTVYSAALFALFSLQSALAWRIGAFGARPDIIPLLVVTVAMREGYAGGAWYGLAAGALCDAFTGGNSIFYMLLYTAAGGATGYIFTVYLQKSYIMALICAITVQTLSNALKYGYFAIIAAGVKFMDFVSILGAEAAFTLIFSVMLYPLLQPVAKTKSSAAYYNLL